VGAVQAPDTQSASKSSIWTGKDPAASDGAPTSVAVYLSFCSFFQSVWLSTRDGRGCWPGREEYVGDPSSIMGLCWRLGGVHKAHDLKIPGRLLGTGCNISSRPRSIYGAEEWGCQDLKQSRTHADDSQHGQSREASVCASLQGCCGAQQPTGQKRLQGGRPKKSQENTVTFKCLLRRSNQY
jgi:hypothetical protein